MAKPASVLIFFTTYLCIVIAIGAKNCMWSNGRGWIINVVNEINGPNKIQVHCKSKDNDIGMKTLGYHETIDWKFCENIIAPSTLFFCHFYNGNKEQVFDVFNDTLGAFCDEKDRKKTYYRCTWMAKLEGFYIKDRRAGPGKLETGLKLHDWKVGRV
uniref:S-protein homolog 1-like n=1 Tax=Erigeron canadensis TaxID=72917 RepID=UPI001CB8FBC3|nr:S-protein homolog 1-like [Erigeron canadensis]